MYLPKRKKQQQGFIPLLGLIATAFLAVSIFIGTAIVSNPNIKFDLRNFASGGCDAETKDACSGYSLAGYKCVWKESRNKCVVSETSKAQEEKRAEKAAQLPVETCLTNPDNNGSGVCTKEACDSLDPPLVLGNGSCNFGHCCYNGTPKTPEACADNCVSGDACPEDQTSVDAVCSSGVCCKPKEKGQVTGDGTTANANTGSVPHHASPPKPTTTISVGADCIQTCLNNDKTATPYSCASQCQVDATRPTSPTTVYQDTCTTQEYLSCPNGCDPSTGKCKTTKTTTGINATAGVTVKPTQTMTPLTAESTAALLAIDSATECLQKGGNWVINSCQPRITSMAQINRKDRINGEQCATNDQCGSGSCHLVQFGKVCTVNLDTPSGQPKRFADAASCKTSCSGQSDEKTCAAVCQQYATHDENLLAVAQTINTLTGGTFANYLAANIKANNEGLTGWDRYTNPELMAANAQFGTVLTAEGALAYTGIGALTGTGTAATFATTANLVNTGYNAYQAQQKCSGATTAEEKKNCLIAIGYTALAGANLGTSALSMAAQGANNAAQAAQLANAARIANGVVSTAEIGVNAYQTYNACNGPNANTTSCLIQAGLSSFHAAGSYADIAYTANQAGNFANSQLNKLVANSVPELSLAQFDVNEVETLNDLMVVNVNDMVTRHMDNPESLLAEHITGLNPAIEPEQLAARIVEDNAIVRTRYNLPPLEMRITDPNEYIRQLRLIANQEGITVKPYYEYEQFFNQNSAAGVYNETGNFLAVKPSEFGTPLEKLVKEANIMEHELIHGLQNRYYPGLPVEGLEYEAYIAGLGPNFLSQLPQHPELAGNMFGYFGVYGSTRWWYEQEGLLPSWLYREQYPLEFSK